jgi:hypothetical protein
MARPSLYRMRTHSAEHSPCVFVGSVDSLWVTAGVFDSRGESGYIKYREYARDVALTPPCSCLCPRGGGLGVISTLRRVTPRRGLESNPYASLSRMKGRCDGESHQKATQISTAWLPLAAYRKTGGSVRPAWSEATAQCWAPCDEGPCCLKVGSM